MARRKTFYGVPYGLSRKQCEREGRMQYKDLDLKAIREECDLDFAHYTYGKGQCSCCYGPKDMPSRYWKNRYIKENGPDDYILFKNADNGSGSVKRDDYIAQRGYICIGWKLSPKKLNKVLKMLREQVGREFVVHKPKNELTCITLTLRDKMKEAKNDRSN